MIPQILLLLLIGANIIAAGHMSGKKKTGYYETGYDVAWLAILLGIVEWGGFFAPLLD